MKPLILPAILAAALGTVGIPTTAGAQSDETTPPAGEADTAPVEEAPPVEEETSPPTTEPSTPDTTVPAPEPTEPVETTPAPSVDTTEGTVLAPVTTTTPEPAPEGAAETKADDNDDDELEADAFAELPDGVVRPISFPVLGPVRYGNDWGNCRDGCARRHVGTDMLGVRMQPLLAAVDGTVTRVRYENHGTAGSAITVTGADGWRYNYFHVNNDTPGTDDGLAGTEWQISPQVTLGSQVRAGQVIAYMGDSGNAETSVPHVHFEIRQPDGTPINPYHSLVEAQERQTCETDEARISLTADAAILPADAVTVIAIDGVGRWLIGGDGNLVAEGSAAYVPPVDGVDCVLTEQPVSPVVPVAPAAVVDQPAPAPLVPADRPWTVERGQTLWGISQTAYGISDDHSTVSAVNAVFDHNRDQLTDPSVLNIGMTLRLPQLAT